MKTKKLLALICAAVLTFAAVGCGEGKNDKNNDKADSSAAAKEDIMTGTALNATNSKLVGRTHSTEDGTLWCALSGSGAAFDFKGKDLSVTIKGDSVASSGNADNYARVAVYVDGERVVDEMIDEPEKTFSVISSDSEAEHQVQVIKLSETAMSTIGIAPLELEEGAAITPAAPKAHRIEFIGDSITCGYGVDDEDKEHHFKTSTEDVTKAYAYKTAQALDADYSMFSISGWGIISGYSDDGKKHEDQTIPQYYSKLGFSYGSFPDGAPQDMDWDFSLYTPDVVVINLGTNDASYVTGKTDRKRDYTDTYKTFIAEIREKYPDAVIIMSLGIMGTELYSSVEDAWYEYQKETGDQNIYAFRFDPQDGANDGYAADWHPTETTHTKASAALAEYIKEVMGW
ncbi:MAG: GDSL family lipase [Ruminococcus sp.]|nr:GDSL family lipase [Ruminococcus sp.]